MAAGYDIYTLLDTLIDRAAWPSESERVAAHASVQLYREVSLFGNMATLIQCQHENAAQTGKWGSGQRYCPECGRLMT